MSQSSGPVSEADLAIVETQLGRTPRGVLAIAYRCPDGAPGVVQTAPRLPDLPGLELLGQDGPRVRYGFTGAAALPIARVTALAPVRDITVKEPDIEATVRRIYEGNLLRPGGVQ